MRKRKEKKLHLGRDQRERKKRGTSKKKGGLPRIDAKKKKGKRNEIQIELPSNTVKNKSKSKRRGKKKGKKKKKPTPFLFKGVVLQEPKEKGGEDLQLSGPLSQEQQARPTSPSISNKDGERGKRRGKKAESPRVPYEPEIRGGKWERRRRR